MQREALGGDVVRRIEHGGERSTDPLGGEGDQLGDEAEHGRLPVVFPEAADEMGVGDEAAPPLADERGAGEGGRQRREAQEDLGHGVVAVQRGRRRRRVGEQAAAAGHLAAPRLYPLLLALNGSRLVKLRRRQICAEGRRRGPKREAAPPGGGFRGGGDPVARPHGKEQWRLGENGRRGRCGDWEGDNKGGGERWGAK
ncbi:unnamed protein product [Urochloa decumbens]|uniref:Uncharacterized protein n=1 Tax=Urochloa decumbens TaxID=240449 RepID=A0ABC9BTE4_9POAL